ncbi:stomatin-like protein 3 [Caerostris extrusa]|uniref:Stomatin-like protein 3 n=1 Tax=Caerostris extrusa TaxID=172846 RepID=A0AAV4T138_CAEEX|nr:stomatin-like protein 3 [Caerostris extrusa]
MAKEVGRNNGILSRALPMMTPLLHINCNRSDHFVYLQTCNQCGVRESQSTKKRRKSIMVPKNGINSIFDYDSVFKYGPANINMKSYRKNDYKSVYTYHAVSISSDDENETTKETLLSVILRNIITFFFYLLAILSFPISFLICLKKVHSLERGVLMRLGKLQPIKGPGFVFILPCIDKWIKIDLRPQNFTVSTSQLLTADGGVVQVESNIEYQISNVLSYVMKLHNHEKTLKDLGLFCLKNVVSEKDLEDLESKKEFISCNLKDELNRSVINWGLEIVNVNLHSVKVLKAAEPVDAIGTIMSALKAATGSSTQHTAAFFPLIPDTVVEKNIDSKGSQHLSSFDARAHIKTGDCIEAVRKLANLAEREGYLKDLNAKFKFDLVGRSTRTFLISFEKGNISVLENIDDSIQSNVQLMLSEDNLKDFLNGEISPLEAYMDGKVMVTGDWSLLRSLAKVFDLCRSKFLDI